MGWLDSREYSFCLTVAGIPGNSMYHQPVMLNTFQELFWNEMLNILFRIYLNLFPTFSRTECLFITPCISGLYMKRAIAFLLSGDGSVCWSVGGSLTLVHTEISQRLFDGLQWNLYSHGPQRMNTDDFFPMRHHEVDIDLWSGVKYLDNYWTDCNEIWYRNDPLRHRSRQSQLHFVLSGN